MPFGCARIALVVGASRSQAQLVGARLEALKLVRRSRAQHGSFERRRAPQQKLPGRARSLGSLGTYGSTPFGQNDIAFEAARAPFDLELTFRDEGTFTVAAISHRGKHVRARRNGAQTEPPASVAEASSSVALNLGEGMYSRGQNRNARYHTALGSARETLSYLEVAAVIGYLREDEQLNGQLDRIVGTLVKLVRAQPSVPCSSRSRAARRSAPSRELASRGWR